MKFTSKEQFNKVMNDDYPMLTEHCWYPDSMFDEDDEDKRGILRKNIDLNALSLLINNDVTFDDITVTRMDDSPYYALLNDLYERIQKNEDMIEFWLL